MNWNRFIYPVLFTSLLMIPSCDEVEEESSHFIFWDQVGDGKITERPVEILLPSDYFSSDEYYPVIYMMDGQNLFSDTNSHWGKSWALADSIAALPEDDPLRKFIIVGIWSVNDRFLEYCPQKPLMNVSVDSLKQCRNGIEPAEVYSDDFLHFLVHGLKPMVDDSLRTLADRQHTYVAGSSMGGLISLYALMEYPQVFGGAACFSTHWPLRLEKNSHLFTDALLNYLPERLNGVSMPTRFYFDRGTATLDAMYGVHQVRIDSLFESLGLESVKYTSLVFEGAEHDEVAWRSNGRATDGLRSIIHQDNQ